MSETIPNYSLDENHEKYMDALVNLARLEDKYHIPAGQRFTVYKDVDGQVYPFENSDNYPPNTDSLSNEYRHHVVQLYEKISKIDKELSAVYASEQQQIRTSPERSAQQEWTPTRYEIELILYSLDNEKDDYFASLYQNYWFYTQLADEETAFTTVCTNPETKDEAKEISRKYSILRRAVDDISLLKVPKINLDPAHDLQAILDGAIRFKVSKLPYFKLCGYAKMCDELLCCIEVLYDTYSAKHTSEKSSLRAIPHYAYYQNGTCKV